VELKGYNAFGKTNFTEAVFDMLMVMKRKTAEMPPT
jgi:recombinational DNA repair ATPase RecF